MPLLAFLFVFLGGATINSVNHPGPRDAKSVAHYIEQSLKHPAPADFSKLND